jgi:hypothetical protein
MEYSIEQIEKWKSKAEKWDKLSEEIAKCYPTDYDNEGNELGTEYPDADLGTIGELAAIAFGWL